MEKKYSAYYVLLVLALLFFFFAGFQLYEEMSNPEESASTIPKWVGPLLGGIAMSILAWNQKKKMDKGKSQEAE